MHTSQPTGVQDHNYATPDCSSRPSTHRSHTHTQTQYTTALAAKRARNGVLHPVLDSEHHADDRDSRAILPL